MLTQEERERVIEIMLGQEKVISLLYDKPSGQQGSGEIDTMPNNELAEYYAQMGIDHAGMMDANEVVDVNQLPFANHEQLIEAMMQDDPHASSSNNLSGVKIATQLNKLQT